jgi:hypothetical protein
MVMDVSIDLKILQGTINEMAAFDYAAIESGASQLLTVDQLVLAMKVLLGHEQSEELLSQITFPSPKQCRATLAERAARPIVD